MEGQALPHAQCTLCGALADRERACSRTGEPLTEDAGLPPAAMNLVVIHDSRDPMQGKDRLRQLKQCPQCQTHYWFSTDYEFEIGGYDTEESLLRLRPEQVQDYLHDPSEKKPPDWQKFKAPRDIERFQPIPPLEHVAPTPEVPSAPRETTINAFADFPPSNALDNGGYWSAVFESVDPRKQNAYWWVTVVAKEGAERSFFARVDTFGPPVGKLAREYVHRQLLATALRGTSNTDYQGSPGFRLRLKLGL